MHFDYVERGVRPRLSRRGRSIASRAECLALQFYYNDVFGRVFTFNVFPPRVVLFVQHSSSVFVPLSYLVKTVHGYGAVGAE